MRALAGLLRQRRTELGTVATRAYAVISAQAEPSPFTRFASRLPGPFDHTPLLATLPDTKVGGATRVRAVRGVAALQILGPTCSQTANAQITRLPNGIRVASETIPFAETTTVGVWINSGSRFETDQNNGVAHFLEHILFKGTQVCTHKFR